MTKAPDERHPQEEALAVLRAYDLHRVATDDDEPVLWATLLKEYWPITLMRLDFDYRFAILASDVADRNLHPDSRSGREELDVWCLEVSDEPRSLRAVPWSQKRSTQEYPVGYLDVTRPGKHKQRVFVHQGEFIAMMTDTLAIAKGYYMYWRREPDGSWVKDEDVGYWIS